MTDRELLELAAKNIGFDYITTYDGECVGWMGREPIKWDPLKDDGDAFRLARGLQMVVYFTSWGAEVRGIFEQNDDDPDAAARRAIVRAAAEFGKRGA